MAETGQDSPQGLAVIPPQLDWKAGQGLPAPPGAGKASHKVYLVHTTYPTARTPAAGNKPPSPRDGGSGEPGLVPHTSGCQGGSLEAEGSVEEAGRGTQGLSSPPIKCVSSVLGRCWTGHPDRQADSSALGDASRKSKACGALCTCVSMDGRMGTHGGPATPWSSAKP